MGTGEKVFTNIIWKLMEQFGAQGVTFIVSIVLARILDPTVYGMIALVTVFTAILGVFVDSGLGSALVQKKEADSLDFSSVFYFNLFMCSMLYIAMFFMAPIIADFYDMPELVSVVRILSLSLIISGVKNIQSAYVQRNMIFKRFFFATLGGTIGAAVVGICMALAGFGVWALVGQYLFNGTVDTIILWCTVKWRPTREFSLKRLKTLFSFGWKILMSALLDTGYGQLRNLLIGKLYSASDLAFYSKAESFPSLIVLNLHSSISNVVFPAIAANQDDKEAVRSMTRRAIKSSTYIIMPFMVGLAVCAKPLVILLLTEKWIPCVPYICIFCFTYAFYPLHAVNLSGIKAMGRSDIFLKLEIIKKVIGLIVLLITIPISVMAMAYSLLFTSVASQIINSWPNKKLMNYSYIQQLKDIFPAIGLSVVMGAIIFPIQLLNLSALVTLAIQVPAGIVIYFVGSKILKIDSFDYIKNIMVEIINKKKTQKSV